VTDLRDRLSDFDAAARRLLRQQPLPRLVLVHARPATCHPDRPLTARGLCHPCYNRAWNAGQHHQHPTTRTRRSQAEFVEDYTWLRAAGCTRRQIAERLGMAYPAVTAAYLRAVNAGLLTPDRRQAA
jgi:CRP-like cAMP-binding protein